MAAKPHCYTRTCIAQTLRTGGHAFLKKRPKSPVGQTLTILPLPRSGGTGRHNGLPASPRPSFLRSYRMAVSTTLTVNGVTRTIELDDPRVTLLDLLRERLELTGTKKGCDRGQCGACTVILDGQRINSCLALAISHDGAHVLTIEGLAQGNRLHPVQEAFLNHDGLQCGFCTPGQIMSAIGLLLEGDACDDPERVREGMSGNLCRCGAYQGITEAVLEAQRALGAASRKEVA
jgi:xanthine dehydrogenase YagT iron-sulfur-binding subunit